MPESLRFNPSRELFSSKEVPRLRQDTLRMVEEEVSESEKSEQTEPTLEAPSSYSEPPQLPELPPSYQVYKNVTITYDGLMSKQMSWNVEEISRHLNSGAVESRVIIERGSNRPGSVDYETLGWVAAWKKLGNPLEFFSQNSNNNLVEITFNPVNFEARIKLHDQEILFSLKEKKAVKEEFIRTCDLLLKDGLLQSIVSVNKEKRKRSIEAHKKQAQAVGVTILGGAATCSIYLMLNWVSKLYPLDSSAISFISDYIVMGVFKWAILGITSFITIQTALKVIYEQRKLNAASIKLPLTYDINILKSRFRQMFTREKIISHKK